MKKGFIKTIIFFLFVFTAISCCNDAEEAMECIEKEQSGACITLWEPVCGCNGKTYGNSCEAESRGIIEYTEGACE